MSPKQPAPVEFQRNAFVPAILAAIVLFVAPALFQVGWTLFVLFAVAILALIVGWFAVQARQWVWVVVFAVIAIVWNPAYPLPFEGPFWIAAQPVAAVTFLVAGALIKNRRASAA